MAFTFIASAGGNNDASGTTLDCTAALNVAAGDLLVVWSKNEGASTTHAVAKTTGSPANTFTHDAGDTRNHTNGDLTGSFGYLLSAAADATATFRQTLGAARPYRRLIVLQFRPDAGETVTRDAGTNAEGTGTALSSGNISTTGTDEVVVGGYAEYSADTTGTELINGVAATEPAASPQASYTSVWYRILTATFTNGAATATMGGTGAYVAGVIAFKSVTAAGGVVNARNGIALSGISAINGITKTTLSAINGLTI